jgi:cation diffusion facilitator CzcD-associated flavoprotein CzcO
LIRWRNVLFGLYFFNLARKKPEQTKAHLVRLVKHQLGDDYDVETHFTPRYNPWDQRLCLVPDADLFEAIRNGSTEVVTGQIDRFVETGIKLTSGQVLPADIIVTATGLKLSALGGLALIVDGAKIDPAQTMAYKGLMFSGVPNLASAFGYTNASWTLKADLTCEYVCRLLNRLDATGMRQATPKPDPSVEERPWLDFTSGYVQRALPHLPKQGAVKPWRLNQNYALDMMALRFGRIDDGVMTFSSPRPAKAKAA